MLFEPDRHEPLQDAQWNESRARDAVRGIVRDMEDALGSGIAWLPHPLDGEAAPDERHYSLYLGASGALWALWYLQRAGAVDLRIAPEALIGPVHEAYLAKPDTEEVVPSYFLGECGPLLFLWRMTGSNAAADALFASVERNIANPTNEALWAAPGTMVAAWHLYEATGEARWRDLFLANVEHVWPLWQRSEHAPCHLWTQDLYGRIVQLLGAGHGFAGNVYPLLRGAALLSPERRRTLFDRCVETLRVTAVAEGDGVNWPSGVGPPRPGRTGILVQWCHGAPGIVTSLTDYPVGESAEMDDLLVRAGNLVWTAGPLAKGPGLCHGTAGNGYAFLKLHRRTGDPVWLERARSFAMHAIGQSERAKAQYGRGRYSLWTGDPGVAVYVWHCVTGGHGMPGLDIVD